MKRFLDLATAGFLTANFFYGQHRPIPERKSTIHAASNRLPWHHPVRSTLTTVLKDYMLKRLLILLMLLIGVFPCYIHAANWYVDNAATGANNGTSWTNAWQSFAAIGWTQIQPGDTVYISGGATQKVYNERLRIFDVNGQNGAPITISIGKESGHDGKVIIDLEYVGDRYECIRICRSNYITITGKNNTDSVPRIKVMRSTYDGVNIDQTSDHIKVEYLESCENGLSDATGGINACPDMLTDLEVCYCDIHDNYQDGLKIGSVISQDKFDLARIHHNKIYNIHDDGIESGLRGLSIYNNEIGKRIFPERGHPDVMQLYGNYLKIYNNYMYDWICYDEEPSENNLEGFLNVIYIENDGGNQTTYGYAGKILVYNNVITETKPIAGRSTSLAICLAFSDPDWTEISDVYVFNNTISGDFATGICAAFSGAAPTHSTVHDFYIANNNFYNSAYENGSCFALNLTKGDLGDITYGSFGDNVDVVVDYNSIYGSGSQATPGYNIHGSNGIDPQIDEVFMPLDETSPIVNSGFDITAIPSLQSILSPEKLASLSYDRNGIFRSAGWDIGAYEYKASPPVNTPTSPLAANNLSKVYTFPNPYRPGSGGINGPAQGITFANLLPKAVIKIFSIFGELALIHEKDNADPQYVWKTVNSSGKQIISGVYIYQVSNPDNPAEKATGKLIIMK